MSTLTLVMTLTQDYLAPNTTTQVKKHCVVTFTMCKSLYTAYKNLTFS